MGDAEREISFCPPLASQRRHFVVEQLVRRGIRRVADLGCSDGSTLAYLAERPFGRGGPDHLVGVDIDPKELKRAATRLRCPPLRTAVVPLTIELYHGDLRRFDPAFASHLRSHRIDAVCALEVIEHIQPEDVPAFIETIFSLGVSLVILSTPNFEFNAWFPGDPKGAGNPKLRHWDHKFEWTRDEFATFCADVCNRFPYTADICGVGDGPGPQHGHASQFCVFERTYSTTRTATAKPAQRSDHGPWSVFEKIEWTAEPFAKLLRVMLERAVYEHARETGSQWVSLLELGLTSPQLKALWNCAPRTYLPGERQLVEPASPASQEVLAEALRSIKAKPGYWHLTERNGQPGVMFGAQRHPRRC